MQEHPPQQVKTPDDLLSEKLADYIDTEQITAEELRDAYYLFSGVTGEHSSPRVHATANLMSEMSSEHYPINRFVSMIGNLEEWEDSPIHLVSYVDSLPITDKEKTMIKLIPVESKIGELQLLVNGKTITSIMINASRNSPGFNLALHEKIKEAISMIKINSKSDLSFWFTEK